MHATKQSHEAGRILDAGEGRDERPGSTHPQNRRLVTHVRHEPETPLKGGPARFGDTLVASWSRLSCGGSGRTLPHRGSNHGFIEVRFRPEAEHFDATSICWNRPRQSSESRNAAAATRTRIVRVRKVRQRRAIDAVVITDEIVGPPWPIVKHLWWSARRLAPRVKNGATIG